MSYWLHPDAEAELGSVAVYYAEHASLKIAEAFLAEFERACDLLIENPAIGAADELSLRRFHFKRFPYTLIYQNSSEGLQIFAIAHQHRRPSYWLERL